MTTEARIIVLQLIDKRLALLQRLSDVYPDMPVVEAETIALKTARQEVMNEVKEIV